MFKEFRDFINRGNVLDLAVAVILATYFGATIKSLVDDIIMPPIGKILGNADFKTLALDIGGVTINYGNFINTVITFLIVAFVIFLIIRQYNKMRPAAPPPAPTKECPYCLSQVPAAATRCPNCTSQLTAGAVS